MADVINIHAAKTHLSKLVDRAAAGEEIVIARSGTPVARLVALDVTGPRRPGLLKGKLQVAADFDEPLPESLRLAFESPLDPAP